MRLVIVLLELREQLFLVLGRELLVGTEDVVNVLALVFVARDLYRPKLEQVHELLQLVLANAPFAINYFFK